MLLLLLQLLLLLLLRLLLVLLTQTLFPAMSRPRPLLFSGSTAGRVFLVSTCVVLTTDGNLGGTIGVEYETLVTCGLVDMLACVAMTPTGLGFILPKGTLAI